MKHQSNDIDLEKLSSPDALTKPDSTRKDVPLQSVNVGVTRIELLTPKDAFQIFEELGSHHVGVDDSEQTEAKRRKISDGAKSESDTEHQSKSAAETAFASSDSNGSGHELESDEEQNNNDMHSSSDSDLEFGEIPPEPMPLPMDEDGDIDPKLLLANSARELPSSSIYSDPARSNSGFGKHTDSSIVSRPNVSAKTKDIMSTRAGLESSGGTTLSTATFVKNETAAGEQKTGLQGAARPLSSIPTNPSQSAKAAGVATPSASASSTAASRSPSTSSNTTIKSQFSVSSQPPKRPHISKSPVPDRNEISPAAANDKPNVRPPTAPVAASNRPPHQPAGSPKTVQPNPSLATGREMDVSPKTTARTITSGTTLVRPVQNTVKPVSPRPPRPVPANMNNSTAGNVVTSPVRPSVAPAARASTESPARPSVTTLPVRPSVAALPARPSVAPTTIPGVVSSPVRPSVAPTTRPSVATSPVRPSVANSPVRPSVPTSLTRPNVAVTARPSAAPTARPSVAPTTRPGVVSSPVKPSVVSPVRPSVTTSPVRPNVTTSPVRPSVAPTTRPSVAPIARPSVATAPVRPNTESPAKTTPQPAAARPTTPTAHLKQTQPHVSNEPTVPNALQKQPPRPIVQPTSPDSANKPSTAVPNSRPAIIRPTAPPVQNTNSQQPVLQRPSVSSALQAQTMSLPVQLISPVSAKIPSTPASEPRPDAVLPTLLSVQTSQNRPPSAITASQTQPAHPAVRPASPASAKEPSISAPIIQPMQLPQTHSEPNKPSEVQPTNHTSTNAASSVPAVAINRDASVNAETRKLHPDTIKAYAVSMSKSADRIAAIIQVLGLFESSGLNPASKFDAAAFNSDASRASAIARSLFESSSS